MRYSCLRDAVLVGRGVLAEARVGGFGRKAVRRMGGAAMMRLCAGDGMENSAPFLIISVALS
jgi:hypothetical protein